MKSILTCVLFVQGVRAVWFTEVMASSVALFELKKIQGVTKGEADVGSHSKHFMYCL